MPLQKSSEKFTNSKEFLKGLKGVDFKMEESKAGMLNSLDHSGGYRLTKGEDLYRAGKLKSVEDMKNAAAYSLDEQDLDGFLDQYGGDKYVKRVFVYGVSKMKRDILMREMNFEKDKQKGGAFAGLKNYSTFQEAFAAGFYKDFNLSYDAIMEKGLSVSEYRQRKKRIRKLESRVARIEAQEETQEEAPQEEVRKGVKTKGAEKKQEKKQEKEPKKAPEKAEEERLKAMKEKVNTAYAAVKNYNDLALEINRKYKGFIEESSITSLTPYADSEESMDQNFYRQQTVNGNLEGFNPDWFNLEKSTIEHLEKTVTENYTNLLSRLEGYIARCKKSVRLYYSYADTPTGAETLEFNYKITDVPAFKKGLSGDIKKLNEAARKIRAAIKNLK